MQYSTLVKAQTLHKAKPFTVPHPVSGEARTFSIVARLVKPASTDGQEWRDEADQWAIDLKSGEFKGEASLDYWTGVGHRSFPIGENPRTRYGVELSKANKPIAADILYSLVSDAQIHEQIRDAEYPEDEIMSDFGYETVKEARGVVKGVAASYRHMQALLVGTGLTLDDVFEALQDAGY